ncbi:hypothetical protein [Actimicrobium sp. CCI2.3]|jgi:hypothetical protein|uniref:hypothetical protein n=1 Tax=Actimicrobium sp. CCI2.3 TaxID=3048616 RepID=UPI002AB375B3|nr:hypothetical protein [Actimicrobium sp. CCI2.3]MDY7576544.1 hypothetical protein [Actimicrobium sp. CCI2.3]MEB0023803.1 hypothetical protein [Actimicrobium sp. CCI2.3]
MNYYRLSFNPQITQGFNMFRLLVQQKYGNNTWISDTDTFYLVATPDSIQDISRNVDVSTDQSGAALPGAATLGLVIEAISVNEEGLPKEAKAWLIRKVEAVEELRAFVDKLDPPS